MKQSLFMGAKISGFRYNCQSHGRYVKTRFGTFYLEETPRGLREVQFPREVKTHKQRKPRGKSRLLMKTGKLLKNYLEGKPVSFRRLPIDLSDFTEFEKKVLKALARVRYGQKRSYRDLAKAAGASGASRAVGSVMRKNRLPIILPCHRIICTNGKLGKYSQGLPWKKCLLGIEKQFLRRRIKIQAFDLSKAG